jgi:hypothetical protein
MKIFFGYLPERKKYFFWLEKENGGCATLPLPEPHNTEVVVRSNNQAVSSVAAQNAINSMNTATQIRQSQTTQQLLQQNQYRVPAPCLGFNCR